jgi:hypothetical protein
MDTTTIIIVVGAIVFGALWLMRRRSRMRSDKFD